MKTKIIYISGSEIFNIADVRNAFDTVRRELGLKDTILFGVPVDADDALGEQFSSVDPIDQNENTVVPEIAPVVENIIEPVVEPIIDEPENPVVKEEKPKRSRKKVIAKTDDTVSENQVEEVAPAEPEKEIIPILSVLGGDAPVDDSDVVSVTDNVAPGIDTQITPVDILDGEPEFVTSAKFDTQTIDDNIPTVEPESATIQDSDDEDDQLEKLLQSVQSLHEDKDDTPEPELKVVENTVDETDATLEKLATEFAENQDKIINTTKSSARGGRIGKLKNILPFKKAKHNDSGLMGDLFGWAGVAANDEEFAIPEFFPTAAKK